MMSADGVEERRRFQRIFYNAHAELQGDEFTLACRLIDISLNGCLLEFDKPWSAGGENSYTLILALSDEDFIRMTLNFTHAQGLQAGFQCQYIDLDSITNLRRLVELNLGDSKMLERELAALRSQ